MPENIIIVGAGGLGREVAGWMSSEIFGPRIKGFLSDNPRILDNYSIDYPIIGSIDDYVVQEDDVFIMAIGDIGPKKEISNKLISRGAKFKTFIHHTAIVEKTAKIGTGCVVGPFCLISDHVVLDDFVLFGFYASCGHDAKVGKYGVLSPYSTVNGFTVLGDEVFMGTHSSVVARTKVGSNSKISSGTAVMYEVPENCFVVGVPGKNQIIFNKE